MSIPEACIEAACGVLGYPPKDRARRVILSLAEALPDSAVRAAYLKLVDCLDDNMLTAYSKTVARTTHQTVIATDDYAALMSALQKTKEGK